MKWKDFHFISQVSHARIAGKSIAAKWSVLYRKVSYQFCEIL